MSEKLTDGAAAKETPTLHNNSRQISRAQEGKISKVSAAQHFAPTVKFIEIQNFFAMKRMYGEAISAGKVTSNHAFLPSFSFNHEHGEGFDFASC